MTVKSCFRLAGSAGVLFSVGISPILPTKAQDAPPQVRARAIIRTADGEQVIDLDPSQLPQGGEGNHVIILRNGPNGEISTFSGSPDMINLNGGGGGGLAFNLPGAGAGSNMGLAVIDPGVSYLYALLKRTDIATEIRLNARQREMLETAETSQQQARQDQMKQSIESLTQGLKNQNPQDLRATLTERAARMKEQALGFTDTRMKTLASILRPEQLARLKELDFQFRGPLAMGVQDVAQLATLNGDLAGKMTGLLKEYRQEVTKNMPGVRTISLRPGSTGAQAAPAPPPNSEEMRGRLVKADREIRKARQVLGAKALATLPEPQRAQWSKLSGKPFEFHPAL